MLRITKQTDYGLVLLSRMATEPTRLFNAPELAEIVHLPLPTVSKILKLLARDGLLESHRGAKGGYCLDRSPDEISVVEIIYCLEGPIAMTECIDDTPGECQQAGACPLQANWQLINQAIRQALEGITLGQMAGPMEPQLIQLSSRKTPTASFPEGIERT